MSTGRETTQRPPVTSRRAKRSRAMTLADARDGDAAFEANRVAGNAAYDREAFVEATARYTECVEALEKRLGSAEGEGTARRACAIRANRAACLVKPGKRAIAMAGASRVVARQPEAAPAPAAFDAAGRGVRESAQGGGQEAYRAEPEQQTAAIGQGSASEPCAGRRGAAGLQGSDEKDFQGGA